MKHHHFKPQHYHRSIGSHPAVLEIAAGDRVTTTTVDAGGYDQNDQQVTPGGNPQTGPFFVSGAEPGDTLVVQLERIAPNRPRGYSSNRIAANVLDFGYHFHHEQQGLDWEVDLEQATAMPLGIPSLEALSLPLAPMLGCFGVAPARDQAISTATSDRHGGNMDYRGFVQGVKVYFPVFVTGALFHLGDAHALQGDGEIVGTGIEISSEVSFSVDLIKGQSISWPRAENDSYLLTFGNARPLDQALQHATTEMLAWLTQGYGFDEQAMHVLLGQTVEYEIGNVFDPAYTVVCKLSKALLESLK